MHIKSTFSSKGTESKDTEIGLQRSGCNSMDSQGDFGHNSHSPLLQFPSVRSKITIPHFYLIHLCCLDSGFFVVVSLSQNTSSSQHAMSSSEQPYGDVPEKKEPYKISTDKTTSTTMQRAAVICGRILSLCHKCNLFFKTQVIPFYSMVN